MISARMADNARQVLAELREREGNTDADNKALEYVMGMLPVIERPEAKDGPEEGDCFKCPSCLELIWKAIAVEVRGRRYCPDCATDVLGLQ